MLKAEWFEIVELEDVPAFFMIDLALLGSGGDGEGDGRLDGRRPGRLRDRDRHAVRVDVDRFQSEPHDVETSGEAADGASRVRRAVAHGGRGRVGRRVAGVALPAQRAEGLLVRGPRPVRPQEVRALLWVGAAASGRVKLVRGEWNEAFLDESKTFPRAPTTIRWTPSRVLPPASRLRLRRWASLRR